MGKDSNLRVEENPNPQERLDEFLDPNEERFTRQAHKRSKELENNKGQS